MASRGPRRRQVSSIDDRFDPSTDTSETLYLQLRRIADIRFRQLPVDEAVQATDILHEVWSRLAARPWNDRQHFVATFARAAQNILVDIARRTRRRRERERRHGNLRLDGDVSAATWHDPIGHPEEFLLLHDAIEALRAESPAAADQLLTHLLLDVPVRTIAEVSEPPVSPRTVQRNLAAARLWIHRWMSRRLAAGDSPAAGEPPSAKGPPEDGTSPPASDGHRPA